MNPARTLCFLLSILCLAACASPTLVSGPEEAIRLAAAQPDGVYVQVTMTVQSTGTGNDSEGGIVFLNSEPDYRSPKSLNIALSPEIVKQLTSSLKIDPAQAFLHRTIRVTGIAKRYPIEFVDGPSAGSIYYQTHLDVHSPDNIQLVN